MQRAILEKKVRNLAVVAASVFALAACGGGGGGGDHGGGLGSGTFTRTYAPATTTSFNALFSGGSFGDVTAQMLTTAAEIGGAGRITKLKFPYFATEATATTCPNTTIRMGH